MPHQYDSVTAIRLALLTNGYWPLPNLCKVPPWHWNKDSFIDSECYSAAARGQDRGGIESWPKRFPDRQSTGVRVQDGMVVVDSDVNDTEMGNKIMGAIQRIAPEVSAKGPLRYGEGAKFAMFAQLEGGVPNDRNYCIHSGIWRAPDDIKVRHVDIYISAPGYGCNQQFGVHGPHTIGPNGEVLIQYEFDGPALHEVPFAELPRITVEQAGKICEAFDALAREAGWTEIIPKKQRAAAGNGTWVFDIDRDETVFDTEHYGPMHYDGLDEDMRCTASFHDGQPHRNATRCWVYRHPAFDGAIAVHDFHTHENHLPKDLDPAVKAAEFGATIRELQAEGALPATPPPPKKYTALVQQLLNNYAYCARSGTVVEIHRAGDDCHLKMEHFTELHASWETEGKPGPRGGKPKMRLATREWSKRRDRKNIAGVRMHPGMPFPLFDYKGELFKNTYRAPAHEGTGTIDIFTAFMKHLLPDPEHCAYAWDWLAHKVQKPWIPMVGLMMVAADKNGPVYGAGRGMLGDIIGKLFPAYVNRVDFAIFSGNSGQADYTDWAAYSLVVLLDEARDNLDNISYAGKSVLYEKLKEQLEPRPVEKTFMVKFGKRIKALACASYLIASNNRDAFQLPGDDRRLTVLANGVRLPPDRAQELQDWMDHPGNIAELYRTLMARDVSGFNPYLPRPTSIKADMQRLARSEIDEAFETIRDRLGRRALFTHEQIIQAVKNETGDMPEAVRRYVKRRLRLEADGAPTSLANLRTRRDALGREHRVYCWRGYTGGEVHSSTAAQNAVEHTDRVLAGTASGDDPNADRRGLGPVEPEAE